MSIFSYLFHPLNTLSLWLDGDPDGGGLGVFYIFAVFIGLGVSLVFMRHSHNVNRALDFEMPALEAARSEWQSLPISNPSLKSHKENSDLLPGLSAENHEYITSFDPATGFHIGTFAAHTEDEIAQKIQRAADAQKSWKNTSFRDRRRVVRSLKKWLVDNQDECARVACRDTGKTIIDAALGEILTTCSKLDWIIRYGEQALQPESRRNNLLLCYKSSKVYYEPLGVVTAIVSWNYPLHNAWSPILAAIFAGNGVVLKCSEHVIWSTMWFVEAIQECLKVCGFDESLVQLVCCWPEQVEALTKSPMIKHITFIGSEPVGRKVAMAAAEHLTPVTMELGGKDPAVILPGCDLNRWSSIWMRGVFQNAGQNCIGIERFIVHSKQHDALYNILVERARMLRMGSVLARSDEGFIQSVDCGAMISRERFEGLTTLIQQAKDAGARVEVGGTPWGYPMHPNGCYFHATVIGNAKPDMVIAQNEVFAPVALLIPYDTVEDAVAIANGTRYGLGASVFGPYQDECLKVAKQLECGMVSINDFAVSYLNQDLPFGGTKGSGYGRFGGAEGLRALTNPKVVIVDRVPWLVQTQIPKGLDYPVRSLIQSWKFLMALIRFAYADSWRDRIDGLITLTQSSR